MRSIEFEHFWTPVLDISVDKNVAEILKDSGKSQRHLWDLVYGP